MRLFFILALLFLKIAGFGQLEMHITGLADYNEFNSKKKNVDIATFEAGELINQFKAGIEWHGQSSLIHPKKNYDFEVRDENGEDSKTSIFGMDIGKDFILNSLAYDGSYIRNTLIFESWKKMGYWSPDYRYLKLIIDGEYRGLYLLCEKITVDEGRVSFPYTDSLQTNFLFKFGRYWFEKRAFAIYQPRDPAILAGGMGYFKSISPKHKKNNTHLFEELSYELSALSSELAQLDDEFQLEFERPKGVFHLQSFIDYFILSEVTKNPDAYLANLYFTFESLGNFNTRKLSVGPQWDYDLAFGNTNQEFFKSIEGWTYIRQAQTPRNDMLFWWNSLSNFDFFKKVVQNRLKQLENRFYGEKNNLSSIIDSLTSLVHPYYRQDSTRWNNGTVALPSNLTQHQTIIQEINALESFYTKRINWVQSNLHQMPKSNNPVFALLTQTAGKIYPHTADKIVLDYPPNGDEHEFPCYYEYELYNPDGVIIESGIIGYEIVTIPVNTFKKGCYFLHLAEVEGDYADPGQPLIRPAVSAVSCYEELYYQVIIE